MGYFGNFYYLSHLAAEWSVLSALPLARSHEYRGWRMPESRYTPHQGDREIARRKRQMERGQIRFIEHGRKG